VAPESPVFPPMPITESNQPNRRTLMIPHDDDLQFRDVEVPLVPVIGSIVDLRQTYRVQHPAPPPTPVIRPVADGNTARIPLFRLDGGSAPFTVGGIVHIWRGVAYVEGPRRQFLAQPKPVIVKEDPARQTVRQPQPQRRRVPPGAQENLDDRARGDYHTSMIPPILGHNESIDEFIVRLRRHMQYVRDFTRSAGLDR
jgi:hypothetical protein